ncbi:nucleotide pyrophosphatase [miscellaneous Crenarchaeota group-15 archaeon DG-45]|uniref:Nucleotide pyrophosphatase n=1 Tax=miscellaneous Crenarchaeota group-15 archaeon DG-45 TaxID=1685127 RepID=A0A0M0BQ71_9ARCH|nr:MAG: nucleotide pyrophosphatase [miscellaneous Crenarchaeota group-15 archaeon DG-45]
MIGLDCAAPELMFHRFVDRLPNIRRMMRRGVHGGLESCDPPITIPAWMVMATSRSPGRLGLYGFRHRRGSSYRDIWIASSRSVGERKIWDHVAEAGGKSCLVAVPPSYPPVPVEGCLVGCFITPDAKREYTHPAGLRGEIEGLVGEYMPDVEFRIDDKRGLLKGVYEMSEGHFKVVEHLMRTRPWQFFMLVEIGLDRIHHAFWKYFDEEHHLHEPGSEFESAVEDYYAYLDGRVGRLLELAGDDTVVLIASDHGGKRMKGAFCLNSWLAEQGLLALKRPAEGATRLDDADVDWGRTVAWGWGGYYARIFLNVEGREPQGVVAPGDYERVRDEIADRIRRIRGPNGEAWRTRVLKPDEVFPECRGDPPDLMVYFDDLYWRSAGTIGHGSIYLPENDTGPDDAVHDKTGLYVYYDPRRDLGGRAEDLRIVDVAPTILKAMGLPIPSEMEGRPLPGI